MVGNAPDFWWEERSWKALALTPAALAYDAVARRRMVQAPRLPVPIPVICVGNFTVGGTGKTPVAVEIAKAAKARGLNPGFLTRGHGGTVGALPHIVKPGRDLARHVGDEPLLLAEHGIVCVSRDRHAGAQRLLARGCDFAIMDDGFQSARIHIDYALQVVDAVRGIGNGKVLPAGPLRASLSTQMRFTDALMVTGKGDGATALIRMAARAAKPVYHAFVEPMNAESIAGKRVLAFAGIGHPPKFFETVKECGADLVQADSFPDHHGFTDTEIAELGETLERRGLIAVTTAKDAARMRSGSKAAQAFLTHCVVLDICLRFDPAGIAERIVGETIARAQRRRFP
ncbi:tetraacyldisaccharide 4'-kinase [Limoniibacter endophyticus]|uniref:Tetraacyldisaccharide 4'-kinase n=1 Tax=Limoniibacter endophyticus TaxID=1565040 RepID=A0A8J3GHS1_9HYPH|nr:tetraacyldisaccharide 4'-kinase [Limoniibacter endophyticus]GHC67912.1 tetraacyldisaccharide 4'-kinase [Limoniibacter endophyticus]